MLFEWIVLMTCRFIEIVRSHFEEYIPFQVFCIEVRFSGYCSVVEKRYSQFEELHKEASYIKFQYLLFIYHRNSVYKVEI